MPPATVLVLCLDADRRAAKDRDHDTSARPTAAAVGHSQGQDDHLVIRRWSRRRPGRVFCSCVTERPHRGSGGPRVRSDRAIGIRGRGCGLELKLNPSSYVPAVCLDADHRAAKDRDRDTITGGDVYRRCRSLSRVRVTTRVSVVVAGAVQVVSSAVRVTERPPYRRERRSTGTK